MKLFRLAHVLSTVSLMAVAHQTAAQFGSYGIGKAAFFTQNSALAPTNALNWSFSAHLFGAPTGGVTALTITTPAGATREASGDRFFFIASNFTAMATLDAAFPAGDYTFAVIAGTFAPTSAVATLPTEAFYPSTVPFFNGDTFVRLASYNPSVPFTFTWNQLPSHPGASRQFVAITIRPQTLFSETAFNLFSSTVAGFTSATVPAGTLAPNTAYRVSLDFRNERYTPDAAFGDFDSSVAFSYSTEVIFVTSSPSDPLHAIYSFVQNQTARGNDRITHTARRGFLIFDPVSQKGTEIIAFVKDRTNKLFTVIPLENYKVDRVSGPGDATYTILAKAESPGTQFAGTRLQASYLRGRDNTVTLGPGETRRLPKTLAGWSRDIIQDADTGATVAGESSGTYVLKVRASAESNAAGETFEQAVARLADTFVARGYIQFSLPVAQ